MLKELSEYIGVSGGEQSIREFIKDRITKDVDEMIEDAYGNLIVRKGRIASLRILLTAHMDEVGFIITGIEKSGLLRFATIGIAPQVLYAKRVVIGKKVVPGVIGHKPVHQASHEETEKLSETKDLFIDVGVSTKEEAKKHVDVGELGTFCTEFREVGDTIFGKAFDDRIGCYMLMQVLRETDVPLYCAFTVQEEAGLRGARIAAYRVDPHVAIAVDATASGEWPEEKDVPQYPEIGKGPVITIADRSLICDKELVALLERTAQKHAIPYQFKKPMIGGTDAGAIHLTRQGVRAVAMQTPARYIHSPLAIASKKDIQAGIQLLIASVKEIAQEEAQWS
jgi:endoglucanase